MGIFSRPTVLGSSKFQRRSSSMGFQGTRNGGPTVVWSQLVHFITRANPGIKADFENSKGIYLVWVTERPMSMQGHSGKDQHAFGHPEVQFVTRDNPGIKAC